MTKYGVVRGFLVASLCLVPTVLMAKAEAVTVPLKGMQSFSIPACNGENITGSVDVNAVIHVTQDSKGYATVVIAGSVKGSGTGDASGVTYQVNESVNLTLTLKRASELTLGIRIRLIGPGTVPNGYVTLLLHVTSNANGNITASIERVAASDCVN